MDSQKRESTNLDNASPLYEVEQTQTTENLRNEIENEFSMKPENLDPKTTTTANVGSGSTSPCDIHFPKTIEVTNCSEYNNCDKVNDKTASPDKQDYVNVIEIEPNIQAENIDKNTEKGANDQISDKEEIVMDTVVNSAQINNCSSPVKKKLKNTIQSPNASIQEVLNKVNELDLLDRPEVLTKMPTAILKHETASLRSLLMYHSESSDNEDEEFDSDWQFQVFPDSSSDDTDSEFDAQECVVEISEDEDNPEFVLPNKNSKKKEKQDCEPFDPPIDLSNIEVDYANEQFTHIGHITNFIGATVTIDALTNSEPYNLETVLFIDDKTSKKPVGAITDVIGPVNQPVYCVQLHDSKDIESLGLKVGMKIYSAPKSSYTKYVFLKDLLRLKGSDASWIGDEEVPSEAESSEEEDGAEDSASRKRSHNNSLERHKKFENEKNRCNVIKTKVAKLVDKCRKRGAQNVHIFPHGFNPSIPPPNMQPNLFGNAKVAPLPAPHQSTLNQLRYMRHNSRFHSDLHPQFPRFGSPNDYFTNNVGYYHNVAGPSHQNQ